MPEQLISKLTTRANEAARRAGFARLETYATTFKLFAGQGKQQLDHAVAMALQSRKRRNCNAGRLFVTGQMDEDGNFHGTLYDVIDRSQLIQDPETPSALSLEPGQDAGPIATDAAADAKPATITPPSAPGEKPATITPPSAPGEKPEFSFKKKS